VTAAYNGSGGGSSQWEAAREAWRSQTTRAKPAWESWVSSTRTKVQDWARQQRVSERLSSAQQAASRAASVAAQQAQSTARRVDAEFDVSGKAAEAAQRAAEAARTANEAAEELNSRFQLRRRARTVLSDLRRTLPLVGCGCGKARWGSGVLHAMATLLYG
jgi:hypothetical protein